MQDFFANFIINGNPNGTGLPQWNAAKPGDKTPDIMVIDVDSKDVKATDDGKFSVLEKKFSE